MIGDDAFCPKTGASLSEESYYDDQGGSHRTAQNDKFTPESHLPGEFTNGAVWSAKAALFNRFRRCHQRHYESNGALYRKAALGLSRLKRTADGKQDWDIHVWYALQRRLHDKGYEVEWMHTHVEPRCPHCHGQLTYERYDNGAVRAECGIRCTTGTEKLNEIRETIATLYFQAFEEEADPDNFLQFGH